MTRRDDSRRPLALATLFACAKHEIPYRPATDGR